MRRADSISKGMRAVARKKSEKTENVQEGVEDQAVDIVDAADEPQVTGREPDEAGETSTPEPDEILDEASEAEPGDTDNAEEPSVPSTPPARRTGFVPMALGGAVAAALGFATANFVKVEGWPFPPAVVDTSAIDDAITALKAGQEGQSQAMADAEAELQARMDAVAGEAARNSEAIGAAQQAAQTDISAAIETFSTRLDGLEAQLADMASRPEADAAIPAEVMAAYEARLDEMRAILDAELAGLAQAQDVARAQEMAALEAAKAADERAALEAVRAAVDAGTPFDGPLSELARFTPDIPASLKAIAGDGVPSLALLQEQFPDAARAAITIANSAIDEDASAGERVGSFLKAQLGMRSLEPREGAGADAVLSRAEAALGHGDSEAALAEISTLDPPVRAALDAWVALAEQRESALQALATLTDEDA